jgi:putative DNA primase/helicase
MGRKGSLEERARAEVERPLTEHGHLAATTDPNQIRTWWDRWPNANVAIVTGKRSGLWVVDVDPEKGGDEALAAWEREHGQEPRSAAARRG